MKTKISIIIPCLNESKNIVFILESLIKIPGLTGIPHEILIVDDQSSDDTYKISKSWIDSQPHSTNIKVIRRDLERRGYGAVVKYGLAYASGEYAVFVSADHVDPINLLPMMYQYLEAGSDLVQVSRYLKENDSKSIPLSYKSLQFIYRLAVRLALAMNIPDSTYSFKMFNRKKIISMGLSSNRFNISPEILFKAILGQMNIRFIPGSQGVRTFGVSKFSFAKEGIGFGMCLIRAFLHRKRIVFWF